MCTQEMTKSGCGIRCKQEESVGLCPNVTQQVLLVCFDWLPSATWVVNVDVVANVDCLVQFQIFSKFTVCATILIRPSAKKCSRMNITRHSLVREHNLLTSAVFGNQQTNNTRHSFSSGHNLLMNQAMDPRRPFGGREGRGGHGGHGLEGRGGCGGAANEINSTDKK